MIASIDWAAIAERARQAMAWMQPPMVTLPRQRVHFVGCAEPADTIRGQQLFLERAVRDPRHWAVGRAFNGNPSACTTYIVLMPCITLVVTLLELIQCRPCDCRVIVDVHADIWTPDPHLNANAVFWLNDDEMRSNLERAVRVAQVVTVPTPQLAGVVAGMNPEVVIVPDFHDGKPFPGGVQAWDAALVIAKGEQQS